MYLAGLAGALAFYIFYQQWLSFLILMAVLCLPWFSLLLSLPAVRALQADLEHPAGLHIGGKAQTRLTGRCTLPAPPFRGKLRLKNAMTGWQRDFRNAADLPTDHCGMLTVEPLKCRCYDYLGLFRFRLKGLFPGVVFVRPYPVNIEPTPDLSRYLARSWRPKPGGGFGENHELRLYRPGDNLQQIHWKLTAKTGKLILRETVEPDSSLVLLKLDLMGTEAEIDEKLGKLLWLSGYLLDSGIRHEIRALTGSGLQMWPVRETADTHRALDALLGCPLATEGTVREDLTPAAWEYYIGGGTDEA